MSPSDRAYGDAETGERPGSESRVRGRGCDSSHDLALLQRELDDLVVLLRRLVKERSSLESCGASTDALEMNGDGIARVREELARRAKQLGDTDAAEDST